MVKEQEQKLRPRRRSRSHGFFDHGEKDIYPLRVRFADGTKEAKTTGICIRRNVEKALPFLRVALQIILGVLATIALLGPAIICCGASVQGIGLLCDYQVLPRGSVVCNNSWVKAQDSMLSDLRPGMTPTTTTMQEVGKLTEIAPALEFIGLAMNTLTTNLSVSYDELSSLDIINPSRDVSLNKTILAAHYTDGTLKEFENKDYAFRNQVLESESDGTDDEVRRGFGQLREAITNRSNTVLALEQTILHTLPFLSHRSLTYNVVHQYLAFVQGREEHAQDLVSIVTESKLAVQDLVSELGQLHAKLTKYGKERERHCSHRLEEMDSSLCRHSPAHDIRMVYSMLEAAWWIHEVLQQAEPSYQRIYHNLLAQRKALEAEVESYDAGWLTKKAVPLYKLRDILDTELRQIDTLVGVYDTSGETIDHIGEQMMSGQGEYMSVVYAFEAAFAKKEIRWW